MTYRQNFTDERSVGKIAKIQTLLSVQPMTTRELSEALPAAPGTVNAYIRHLRTDIHIARWDRLMPRNYPVPVWAWGVGKDAKKPPLVTKAESCRKWRREMKLDAERFMDLERRRKAAQIRPFRDPLTEAMYGKAA